MKSLSFVVLSLSLTLPLAAAPGAPAKAKETFGAPLKGLAPVAVADILKSPATYSGKTVRAEGRVATVCQQKGCWMTIGTPDQPIRITFKDYAFFVPKDIAGSTVTVEGVFKVETIPEATAKHYADETPGGNAASIKGDQKQLSLEATGVELTRAAK